MYAAHTGRILETISKENEDGIFLGTVNASAHMVGSRPNPQWTFSTVTIQTR